MTSQGSASGRFTRAIQQRNLWAAEMALREMGTPSLLDALDYLALLADVKPERLERAAVRWHGRLEVEASAAVALFLAAPSRRRRLLKHPLQATMT